MKMIDNDSVNSLVSCSCLDLFWDDVEYSTHIYVSDVVSEFIWDFVYGSISRSFIGSIYFSIWDSIVPLKLSQKEQI